MKDRIKMVRKAVGLTQQAFADKLGIKQNTVALYEMGRSGVSDGIITSICREFNVNETWLRTGEGEMFRKRTDNEILTEFAADLVFEADDSFKKAIVTTFAKMDDDTWDHFEKWARKFLEQFHEIKKEQD